MAEQSTDALAIVGEPHRLPQSFFMALARLILAAHDAEKSRENEASKAAGAAP
jgi:hypothetical protein